MPAHVICVGHAALDRVYRVGEIPSEPGKYRAIEHIEVGGGMAANAAVAVSRLGGKAELWSRVGDDDAGVKVRRGLEIEKVDVRAVERFDDARTSTSAILVDRHGERLIVSARDVTMPSGTSWLPLERIADADMVLADLRWMEGTRTAFARARATGTPTVLDCDLGGREALPELLGVTDYAIFSEPALIEFVGTDDLRQGLERIMLHGAKHVGVTRGANGYMWLDGFGGGTMPAFPVDVVDTTGAGDAFHGAFALALAEGRSVRECARFAAATAALKCTRLGSRAGLPQRSDVEALIRQSPAL
ncbi:MAG: PfkB family carbohydrate kinase [Hyphomicrobiaceae bacterium]